MREPNVVTPLRSTHVSASHHAVSQAHWFAARCREPAFNRRRLAAVNTESFTSSVRARTIHHGPFGKGPTLLRSRKRSARVRAHVSTSDFVRISTVVAEQELNLPQGTHSRASFTLGWRALSVRSHPVTSLLASPQHDEHARIAGVTRPDACAPFACTGTRAPCSGTLLAALTRGQGLGLEGSSSDPRAVQGTRGRGRIPGRVPSSYRSDDPATAACAARASFDVRACRTAHHRGLNRAGRTSIPVSARFAQVVSLAAAWPLGDARCARSCVGIRARGCELPSHGRVLRRLGCRIRRSPNAVSIASSDPVREAVSTTLGHVSDAPPTRSTEATVLGTTTSSRHCVPHRITCARSCSSLFRST